MRGFFNGNYYSSKKKIGVLKTGIILGPLINLKPTIMVIRTYNIPDADMFESGRTIRQLFKDTYIQVEDTGKIYQELFRVAELNEVNYFENINYKIVTKNQENIPLYIFVPWYKRFFFKWKIGTNWFQSKDNIMWIVNITVALIGILTAFKLINA